MHQLPAPLPCSARLLRPVGGRLDADAHGDVGLDEVFAWIAPHRHAWHALPMVMLAFIVLALVPVMLPMAATGIAFGRCSGRRSAMAGCLASASMNFAISRWYGLRRVQYLGGGRIVRIT